MGTAERLALTSSCTGSIEELIFNRQQNKRALANIAYDANAERRLFSGVEGEGKAHEGELYGVKVSRDRQSRRSH